MKLSLEQQHNLLLTDSAAERSEGEGQFLNGFLVLPGQEGHHGLLIDEKRLHVTVLPLSAEAIGQQVDGIPVAAFKHLEPAPAKNARD